MKIFSAEQIRRWDQFTIQNEPISSINLMERAAKACFHYLEKMVHMDQPIAVFCGRGNNGGDGLALARMMYEAGYRVRVFLFGDKNASQNHLTNLARFRQLQEPEVILGLDSLSDLKNTIIIDAMFGTGINKPISGLYAEVINHLNELKDAPKYSIDIPSGLYPNASSLGNVVFKSTCTLTFQAPKLALLMPENAAFLQSFSVLDIGLSQEFETEEPAVFFTTENITDIPRRKQFAHKGTYGFAGLIAGSYGMMGAAVLSAKACLKSGVGKLTCIICREGYQIVQGSVPEAMCRVYGDTYIQGVEGLEQFDVIGIGPGIGQFPQHRELLLQVFGLNKPIVLDADGLNMLSNNKDLLEKIPHGTIITPHPKEFERLFGKTRNNFEERERALKMAAQYGIYIILKGRYSMVATPEGKAYFNTTGNPGMATAGSGDVLTGILIGLLAQGFSPLETCRIGVYLHGLAGDIAAEEVSEYSLLASDIVKSIGKAYLRITAKSNTQD